MIKLGYLPIRYQVSKKPQIWLNANIAIEILINMLLRDIYLNAKRSSIKLSDHRLKMKLYKSKKFVEASICHLGSIQRSHRI
jgi:hypothetical protein